MGNSLYVTVEKETAFIDEVYWWPLVFEAMHQASMQFQRPEDAMRRGAYFSMEQMDRVECTFQEFWKHIYMKEDHGLVFFWQASGGEDALCLETSMYQSKESLWCIAFILENAYLFNDNPEENTRSVITLLRASLALYRMCTPATLSMYWDKWETPFMQIIEQEQPTSLVPVHCGERMLQWKKIASVSGQHIFVVDPFPLRLSWRNVQFISLPTLDDDWLREG